METISIEIVNPKAEKLLQNLAELDLIRIKSQNFVTKSEIFVEKARQQDVATDIQTVLQQADEKEVQRLNKLFENYQFSFENFKFNRDEANYYD